MGSKKRKLNKKTTPKTKKAKKNLGAKTIFAWITGGVCFLIAMECAWRLGQHLKAFPVWGVVIGTLMYAVVVGILVRKWGASAALFGFKRKNPGIWYSSLFTLMFPLIFALGIGEGLLDTTATEIALIIVALSTAIFAVSLEKNNKQTLTGLALLCAVSVLGGYLTGAYRQYELGGTILGITLLTMIVSMFIHEKFHNKTLGTVSTYSLAAILYALLGLFKVHPFYATGLLIGIIGLLILTGWCAEKTNKKAKT